MHICLVAWGTRGDVVPFVALGQGLEEAGHRVTVTAAKDLAGVVADGGLTFQPFDLSISDAMSSPRGMAWIEGASLGGFSEAMRMERVVRAFTPAAVKSLAALPRDADALISGMLTIDACQAVADARGLKHIEGLLAPWLPSHNGACSVYPIRSGSTTRLNQLTGQLVQAGSFRLIRPVGQAMRADLGLKPLTTRGFAKVRAHTPVLLGTSPHLVPEPVEWAGRVHVTGHWAPRHRDANPPQDLVDFLDAGDPPVHIGFGSMPSSRPEVLWDTMVSALRTVGRRGLVQGSWGDWKPTTVPDDVFFCPPVSHEWLFPRVAAVVHHGGAGTTHTAALAGVPQMVVAHFADQFYWGRRVRDLWLGPPALGLHQLNPYSLAEGLHHLVNVPRYRTEATAMAALMASENGVARAVEVIRGMWD